MPRIGPSTIQQDATGHFIAFKEGIISRFDDEDLAEISRWRWHLHNHRSDFYVRRHHGNGWLRLHRYIAGAAGLETVDHINGNTLDNRRANLRVCTRQQNGWNRAANKASKSPYKGVRLEKNKWLAAIRVDGRRQRLGLFATAEEAAEAYNSAALKHFGEFARLNIPGGGSCSVAS